MKLFNCPVCGQPAAAVRGDGGSSNAAGVDETKCTSPRAYRGEAGWICPDLDAGAAAAIDATPEAAMAAAV